MIISQLALSNNNRMFGDITTRKNNRINCNKFLGLKIKKQINTYTIIKQNPTFIV